MKKSAVKKFALITMFLLSFSFVLTGCTLFERNLEKYYNTVVVSIEYQDGNKIDITKKELLTAFNNYGASLVSESNYTIEDALDATITALINQKVMLEAGEGELEFDNADKNYLWDTSFDSLDQNINKYASEVREDWDIATPETAESEEETLVVYTPYEPTATLEIENGQYVIKVVEEEESDEQLKYADMADIENKTLITTNLYNAVMAKTVFTLTGELTDLQKLQRQEARVYEEAVSRYTKALISAEEGQNLSTDSESVFKREIENVYKNVLTNLKVTKMQEKIARDTTYSSFSVQDVLNKYKEMLLESVQKYSIAPDSLDEDLLGEFSSVNYTESQDYFFVSHILLKFSAEQQAEYDELSTQLSKNLISASYYNTRLDELVSQIVAIEKDEDGNIIEDSNKQAETILTEIQNAMAAANTDEQKAEAFRNLLYKYNQDDGAMNSEYLYVIGTETSKMVETFTEAARELFDEGDGEFGGVSGLVPSQYGVHILFYAGPVSQVFPIQVNSVDNVVLSTDDIAILNETLLNPLNNKTIFDKVFSSLTEASSSANELMYLNNLKKDLEITKYVSRYKDLLG